MKETKTSQTGNSGGGNEASGGGKHVSPNSDTLRRKNKSLDKNNNTTNTLPRSAKLNGTTPKEKIIPDLIIPPKPKSPVDDGYSTASQNGGTPSTLYTPQSFITSSAQDSSKNKFFTGKRFNIGSLKKSFGSPSQVKKQFSTSPLSKQTSPEEVKMPSPIPIVQEKPAEEKGMNTLTREEINDLNDLLSMFDEIEGNETSNNKPVSQSKDEISTKKNLPPPPSYLETQTLGRKPLSKQQQSMKGNLPRTQSQNYGKRTDDTVDDQSRHPIVRSQTLTRPRRKSESEKNFEKRGSSSKVNDLDFLQDVVSELLAVGKVDDTELSKQIIKPKEDPQKSNLASIGSIENFLNDITSKADSFNRSLHEDQNSEESEEETQETSGEGNDSGIEDETMPGLTKESNHKRKSSSKHRKHDGEEHRSSRRHSDKRKEKHRDEKDRLKRSDSEYRKNEKHGNSDRHHSNTNSLPRSDKHKAKPNGDVTVRIDGHDYNSENIGRHGRSKERRSEPPMPSKPPIDPKIKTKTRRSEPVHHSRTSHNDTEAAKAGNHSRALTDSHVYKQHKERSKSPEKKERHRSKSPKTKSDDYKKLNGAEVTRNNSLHISSKSSEYMWDTPDGKHRVYVRPKEEDPGPLPKKEKLKDFDSNIRSMVNGRGDDHELVDQLGVTPDILKLLREEEKFWQRQQELKEWRKTKDSSRENHPPAPSSYPPYDQKAYHSRPEPVPQLKRNTVADAEVLREAEENRLALQAEKLMKIRAEQEHILKTSRENLLDDTDYGRPPPPKNYKPPSHSSGSNHSYHHSYQNVNKSHPTSPTYNKTFPTHSHSSHEQSDRYNSDNYHQRSTGSSDLQSPTLPPVDRSRKNSRTNSTGEQRYRSPVQEEVKTVTKVYPTMGAFSDDDEVFNDPRNKSQNTDYRGYFSDDGFRDNTISKTYLARPMFRQQNATVRCTNCSKIIRDNRFVYVEGQGFYWHSACFQCVVCKALLNDNNAIRVRMVGMKLHCRFCTSGRNGEQLLSEV